MSRDGVVDGGYGWVVVFASFVCQLIADGCAFSFGILYVELLSYFGESKSRTAWVGSLFIAVPLITGPIAGALTSRYGCRAVTVVGGVVAGLGCAISSQADSVAMLCVSFGLVAGFGLSMVYMPAVVVITHYFDAKLGVATGIAVAGSGIGTFMFAPITDLLINQYGWRGAMLLLGGIMLHLCVFGMLFRPNTLPTSTLDTSPRGSVATLTKLNSYPRDSEATLAKLDSYPRDTDATLAKLDGYPRDTDATLAKLDGYPRGSEATLAKLQLPTPPIHASIASLNATQTALVIDAATEKQKGSLLSLHLPESTNGSHLDLHENELPTTNPKTASQTSLAETRTKFSSVASLKQMLRSIDFTVLLDPAFRYFCLSIFLLYISYDIPYMFTPDKAIRMGISEERASFLVSIIGITSTVGQIVVGIIGDHPRVNTIVLYNTFTIIAGLFTFFVPWYTNYGLLCMFAACYGIFISANYTLVSVILVDLLGVEVFTHAYGFEVLAEGLANIIGPPIGGWLTDAMGNYDVTFMVNGGIMIISGAMLFAMPCLSRTQRPRTPIPINTTVSEEA